MSQSASDPNVRKPPPEFSSVFASSRQYDHFNETMNCYRNVPPLTQQTHSFEDGTEEKKQTLPIELLDEGDEEMSDGELSEERFSSGSGEKVESTHNNISEKNKNENIVANLPSENDCSLESCIEFRRKFFKPEIYLASKLRSRYIMPNINYYFQAAKEEGTFHNSVAVTIVESSDPALAPKRRWYKPALSDSQSELDPDEETGDETSDDDDDCECVTITPNRHYIPDKQVNGKRPLSPTEFFKDTPVKKKAKVPSRESTVDSETNVDNINDEAAVKAAENNRAIKKKFTLKVRDPNNDIPSKDTSIQKLFELTKHLMELKEDKSLAYDCVICFDNSDIKGDVIQCNSPFCEVRVHSGCYWMDITNKGTWKCDKCSQFQQDNTAPILGTCCALCPDTTGLFCKLDSSDIDIPWVHYSCASVFLTKSDVINKFVASFDEIPFKNFETTCCYCDFIPGTNGVKANRVEVSTFGAKLNSPKPAHVTCIQKKVNPSIDDIQKTPVGIKRLQSFDNYLKWIEKRDEYIEREFKKGRAMVTMDIWKRLAKTHQLSIEMGTTELNDHYERFLTDMNEASYSFDITFYSSWVDYCLRLIATKFSKRQFEKMGTLSLDSFTSKIDYDYPYYNNHLQNETIQHKPKKPLVKKYFTGVYETEGPSKKKSTKTKKVKNQTKPVSLEKTKTPPSLSKKKLLSSKAVTPSPDLICTICKQHDIPQERIESLPLKPGHMASLENTKHQRKPGYTGKSDYWDPRVFIKCSQCGDLVHCGCPDFPIKDYPSRHETYICLTCDPHEDEPPQKIVSTKRAKKAINYKV